MELVSTVYKETDVIENMIKENKEYQKELKVKPGRVRKSLFFKKGELNLDLIRESDFIFMK